TMIIHSDQFGDNVKIMNMLIENKGILNKPLLSLSEKEFNLLGVVAKEIYMPWPAARRGGYSFLNYYRKFRKRLEGFGTTDTVRKKELWEMDHVHTALIDLSDPELESVRKLAVSNGIALRLFEENMDKSLWEIFREVECGEFLGSVKDDKAALDPVKLFIVEGTFSCQGHKLFDPEPERLKSDISVFIEVDEETRELRIKQRAEEGWEMDVLDMPPNDIIYSPTVDMLRESADIVIDNNQETNEYQIVKMAGIKTQFGITTETAKHLLTREFIQGLKGTDVFVLPSELFRGGRNYADIEFVIYFNTFLKQGMRVTLVGTPEQLENFKIYMGNSLFNPDESSERVRSYDEDLRKFFKTTTELYALKDKSGKILSLENYIDFVPFENGEAMIGKEDRKIKINMLKLNKFSIVEIGRETEPVTVELDYRAPSVAMPPISERFKKALTEAPEQRFAITTLGTSHGFDVAGDYTNFIVWLEGEGILVDPSPQALEYIDRLGIDEDLIPYVFLTHTHADHDSGTLRKILKKRRIKLIATKPVFDSFIEKTRVLVGSDSDATRWVEHIEVKSGRGNEFELELSNGAYATIAVRWNLHSIPTNGLKITYGDYVFGYSGDIEYDKEKIQGLLKDGKITEEQAHDLLFFFWDANGKPKVDLLFHEAGMKPLHTPIANIGEFPSAVREVTRLVHIADKDVPEDAVVKKAKGFETFVLIESDEQSRLRSILKPIDIAAMYIANLTPSKKAEIYEKGTIKEFKKGDLIVHEGDEVDDASEFYIILSGRCEVHTADKPRLIAGDCIGDWAFETNKVRSASVIAESDVTVIALNRVQYDSIIKSEESTREVKLIKKNIGLIQAWVRHTSEEEIYSLSSYSMKHLSVKLQRRKYKKGEIIIKQGEKGEEFFIIDSGSVTVYDESVSPVKRKATFGGKGRYFGETAFLSEDNNLRNATVVAETDLDVAVMSKEDFDKVLHDYPGLHYALKKYSDKRKNAWREEVPPITKKREEKVSRDFVKDIYKRIRAIETGRQGEKIVIGIDTSWIPKVQGSLQSLLSEIYGLRDIDPERIIIVRGNNGRELARDIMKEIEDHPESNAPNVIVFGKASDIRFGEFRELESSKAERKALLVGIDPKNLMEEVPAGKANYIRVIEMIKAALELANMDEEPDTMSIPGMENAYRIGPRRWLFIPKAEHLPIERINELYEAQLTAMKDA
ncbi:MAG: cyclic nucleotide-binding domain-containing protein, partial [Candidatus Omnitrophica bacterium]|nr:cyclic nucleotide-binding domain-containing protein [Candidatus Omnitrophota bacterium]